MASTGEMTYARMASEFPVRTALFTIGPVAFALAQLAISVTNRASVGLTGAFVVLLLAFAVQINRYHLAAFRRRSLSRRWIGE